jgi:hypothetical protein
MGDEELRSVGAGTGVRHRQHAGAVMAQIGAAFVAEAISRTAAAGPFGATALNHEVGDDTVEAQAVVVLAARKVDEVRDRDGRLVGKQVDLDGARASWRRGLAGWTWFAPRSGRAL